MVNEGQLRLTRREGHFWREIFLRSDGCLNADFLCPLVSWSVAARRSAGAACAMLTTFLRRAFPPAFFAVPFTALFAVPFGVLFVVPFCVLFGVPFGVPFDARVAFGVSVFGVRAFRAGFSCGVAVALRAALRLGRFGVGSVCIN